MRYLVVFFGFLIGYTFIYAGISKFWNGVTAVYNPALIAGAGSTSSQSGAGAAPAAGAAAAGGVGG